MSVWCIGVEVNSSSLCVGVREVDGVSVGLVVVDVCSVVGVAVGLVIVDVHGVAVAEVFGRLEAG